VARGSQLAFEFNIILFLGRFWLNKASHFCLIYACKPQELTSCLLTSIGFWDLIVNVCFWKWGISVDPHWAPFESSIGVMPEVVEIERDLPILH